VSVTTSSQTRPGEYLAGTWNIDPIHSYIGFVIKHLMVNKIRGQFEHVSGQITTGDRLEDSTVSATVDVASIHTNNEQRNEHLRSPDFFDAARYPTIAFTSERFRLEGETLFVDGTLEMHGVAKDVTLQSGPPAFGGPGPEGTLVVGFSATGSISRSDFGLGFNVPMQSGGFMLGEEVQFVLEIEATLKG
jgi:polyisoprenoid-binding protein YceI